MSLTAFILLSIAAVTHAGWNLIGKQRHPSAAFFLMANMFGTACVLLPVLMFYSPVLADLPIAVWGLTLASGVSLSVYIVSLAGAYKEGDLSLVYPLSRGVSVCLITTAATLAGGPGSPGYWFYAGVILLTMGCTMLPLRRFTEFTRDRYVNRSCLLAVAAAAGIAGYTIMDSIGLRLLEGTMGDRFSNATLSAVYLALEGSFGCLLTGCYVACRKEQRRLIPGIFLNYRGPMAVTGVGIYLTYGLVLMSMNHVSNVSYVGVFRQLSIPIGALMGMLLLAEPRYTPRILGVAMVAGGIAITALA